MKKMLVLLFFWPLMAFSQVSLEFRSVTAPELVEGVIKGILHRDYVIAPDVLTNQARLTMSLKQIDQSAVLPVLQSVVAQAGIVIEEKEGVLYVRNRSDYLSAQSVQVVQPVQPGQFVQPVQSGQSGQLVQSVQSGQIPLSSVALEELSFHRPRGRSVDFLASVARVAGAHVPEIKSKSDLLVYGGDKRVVERVKKLLDEIDQPAESVTVRAALVEFTDGESDSRSFNLALSVLGSKLGLIYQAGQTLSNALTFKTATLQAALSAIDGDTRFRHVAEPQIRVMNGESARFMVGSEVPTRSSAMIDKNGNPVQSIEYRNAGVMITIEPRIMADSIQIKVGQQISSFTLTNTSNIDSPTILKREAETTVVAHDGELIVLAGMDENRETESTSGLSFLPAFLRAKDSQNNRSQMLLMLEVRKIPVPI